jgi:hypothetical protein
MPGDLHGGHADATGGAIDEHSLAAHQLAGAAQEMERRRASEGDCRGLLECQACWLRCQRAVLAHGPVLGMASKTRRAESDGGIARESA